MTDTMNDTTNFDAWEWLNTRGWTQHVILGNENLQYWTHPERAAGHPCSLLWAMTLEVRNLTDPNVKTREELIAEVQQQMKVSYDEYSSGIRFQGGKGYWLDFTTDMGLLRKAFR